MFTLRQATLQDRDTIIDLVFKSHLDISSNTVDERKQQENDLQTDFEQLLNEERFINTVNFVAEVNRQIVGNINVEHQTDKIVLSCFHVAKEYRGKFIGKHLFDTSIDYCSKNFPGKPLELIALENRNIVAIEMYKRRGFKQISKEIHGSYNVITFLLSVDCQN